MSLITGVREPHSTPCVGICSTTNVGDKYCRGCKRHERWVRNWNQYSKDTKTRINNFIKGGTQ